MIKFKLLLATAALCTAFCFNAEAKLYKWVDENGTTHYGETIPPEYAGRDAKKLEKGRVVDRDDTFDSGKTGAAKDATVDKATIEAKRRDSALLNSYSNEKEIDLARDRNLMQVEARVNSYTTLLKSARADLDDLHKEGNALTQKGRTIPQSLTEDIGEAEARVAKLQKDLDTSQKESEAVKARYEADKQRYRELKGMSPSAK
jgi:chromosome segregation ATPase